MNEEQSSAAVVRFLIAVAHADGRLDDQETEALQVAIVRLTISEEERERLESELKNPGSIDSSARRLEREEDKMFVLLHGLRVALADGNYDKKERKRIEALARKLEISSEILDGLESQVSAEHDKS